MIYPELGKGCRLLNFSKKVVVLVKVWRALVGGGKCAYGGKSHVGWVLAARGGKRVKGGGLWARAKLKILRKEKGKKMKKANDQMRECSFFEKRQDRRIMRGIKN